MHTIIGKKLLMLKPTQIKISKSNLRQNVDTESIKLLAESISVNGIIQPLAVRKNKSGFYELIIGERRLRGAVMAGLRRVPCILYNLTDSECALYSVTENLQRKPLDPFSEAQSIERLNSLYGIPNTKAAAALGLSISDFSYKLQLLELQTEIIEQLRNLPKGEEYARLLLLLPTYKRPEILESILTDKLNLTETEKLVDKTLNPEPLYKTETTLAITEPEPKKEILPPVRKYSIGDVRLFGNSLAKLTDTLKSAGININLRKTENDKYIEYKVRIKKEPTESGNFTQLKIC